MAVRSIDRAAGAVTTARPDEAHVWVVEHHLEHHLEEAPVEEDPTPESLKAIEEEALGEGETQIETGVETGVATEEGLEEGPEGALLEPEERLEEEELLGAEVEV